MIARITGTLESIDAHTALILPPGGWLAISTLLPACVARKLIDRVGQTVTLHTHLVLQSPDQGASFEPRLIGFLTPQERAFFDLFTTVKGIGTRKALRALAEPVAVIAAAVHRADARALTQLPEIGKRLAETIIVELRGKLDPFLTAGALEVGIRGEPPTADEGGPLSAPEAEAVEVLVRLGEVRAEAVRRVGRAVVRLKDQAGDPLDAQRLVSAIFAGG